MTTPFLKDLATRSRPLPNDVTLDEATGVYTMVCHSKALRHKGWHGAMFNLLLKPQRRFGKFNLVAIDELRTTADRTNYYVEAKVRLVPEGGNK